MHSKTGIPKSEIYRDKILELHRLGMNTQAIADRSGLTRRVVFRVLSDSYLGEGFDDPRLDTLFLAFPISWRGRLAQYAGRLHRLHEDKKQVIIYDYADFNVPVLARMYRRRKAGYKRMGYRFQDDSSQNQFEL